ncbi:hypothetical protein FN846DRAFT_170225, partial [Sphaerosporella brunnea]
MHRTYAARSRAATAASASAAATSRTRGTQGRRHESHAVAASHTAESCSARSSVAVAARADGGAPGLAFEAVAEVGGGAAGEEEGGGEEDGDAEVRCEAVCGRHVCVCDARLGRGGEVRAFFFFFALFNLGGCVLVDCGKAAQLVGLDECPV